MSFIYFLLPLPVVGWFLNTKVKKLNLICKDIN
nr:MAG TPA: hypothetical protein [Caudoviricetes sp.]